MERQLAAFKRAYGIGTAAPSAAEPRPADMSLEYGQDKDTIGHARNRYVGKSQSCMEPPLQRSTQLQPQEQAAGVSGEGSAGENAAAEESESSTASAAGAASTVRDLYGGSSHPYANTATSISGRL